MKGDEQGQRDEEQGQLDDEQRQRDDDRGPAVSGSATYCFCLLRGAAPPELDPVAEGMPGGGPARLLRVDDELWMIVGDVPLSQYGTEALEDNVDDLEWVSRCAVSHERVVGACVGHGDLLPMKLFTMFKTDERARAHVADSRDRLEALLDRVAGCVEIGVQVRFDPGAARDSLAREVGGAGADGGDSPGRDFLLAKQRQRDGVREALVEARQRVDQAFEELGAAAVDRSRQEITAAKTDEGRPLLLDAAYLVRESAMADFEEAVAEVGERLAEHHCELSFTGPWPPYNFAEEVA